MKGDSPRREVKNWHSPPWKAIKAEFAAGGPKASKTIIKIEDG